MRPDKKPEARPTNKKRAIIMDDHQLVKMKSIIKTYQPLIIVTLFSVIISLVLAKDGQELIYRFMGFFLIIFSLFKWIDFFGFVNAFKQYDVVSKLFKPYAYLYPAIEFILGLGYIKMQFLIICNIFTIIVMALLAISIGKAIAQKRKLSCACLGTAFNLPLTIVSLFEAVFMLFMAAIML